MEREVAEEILALMREYSGKLNRSVQLVKDRCSKEEFIDYRKAVGVIMGEMCVEIMWPIFHEHPDLEPEELKPGYRSAEKPTNSTKPARARKTTKRSG